MMDEQRSNSPPKEKKFIDHDTSPAIIKDHAFEPRGEWYTLCKHCSLAMAAHSETTVDPRDHIAYYGDHNTDE